MDATAASTKRSSEYASRQIMPEKKPKLADLPPDALTSIIDMAGGDMNQVLKLANSTEHFLTVVQQWQCSTPTCTNCVFATVEGADGTMELKNQDGAIPFGCVTCGEKYCGACDEGSDCRDCKKKECRRCHSSHEDNCCVCDSIQKFCKGCQGACDECCYLCGFSLCQYHSFMCEECGVVTCGKHEFSVQFCSFCDKGFCPLGHGDGDFTWHCDSCQAYSCNAHGLNDNGCPKFVFDEELRCYCGNCAKKERVGGES